MLIVDKNFSNKIISILIEYEYNYLLKSILRSLSSDKETVSVRLDKARWKDELNLMKYYYDIKNNRSLVACLTPIIVVNRDIKEILNEAVKVYSAMYGNEKNMILSIYVIILYILNEEIKSNLISYQIEFENSSEVIEFQREKIGFLMMDDEDKMLSFALDKIYPNLKSNDLEIDSFYNKEKKLALEFRKVVKEKLENTLNVVQTGSGVELLSEYILNLRNMKIKRKAYEDKINPLDIVKMEENKEYNISLIGNIKILRKYFDKDILLIEVVSKSENYTFRFKKA